MNDETQQTDAGRLEKEEIEDLGTVTLARGEHVTGSAAAPSAADFASAAVALSLAQVGEEEGASAPVLASSMGILTASSFPDFAIAITCLLSCRRRRLRSQLRSCRRRQEPRRPGHQPLQPPQPRGRRRSASTQPQRACSQPAAASRPKP